MICFTDDDDDDDDKEQRKNRFARVEETSKVYLVKGTGYP